MTIEELRDQAKTFADDIQAHDASRRPMPDPLNERFRSIVASFQEIFPALNVWKDWKDLTTGAAFNHAQAYKWARKIQDFCDGQLRMERIRPVRLC